MPPICSRLSRLSVFLGIFTLASSPAAALTITTLNVKWFGLNGSLDGELGSETRVDSIKAHLKDNDLLADVIAFEEVVDVELLQAKVLGTRYACHSYEHFDSRHQHVVVCHKKEYTLALASDDDNYALEEVAIGHDRLRPGVHGILKKGGKELLHIIAVHLKAMPECSAERMEQVNAIAAYLEDATDEVPAVVLGDTNTFDDDADKMDRALGKSGVGLKQVATSGRYTWRTPAKGSKFDRVWLSKDLATGATAEVVGPCNSTSRADIQRYNEKVSDHCAVKVSVKASTP